MGRLELITLGALDEWPIGFGFGGNALEVTMRSEEAREELRDAVVHGLECAEAVLAAPPYLAAGLRVEAGNEGEALAADGAREVAGWVGVVDSTLLGALLELTDGLTDALVVVAVHLAATGTTVGVEAVARGGAAVVLLDGLDGAATRAGLRAHAASDASFAWGLAHCGTVKADGRQNHLIGENT